MVVDRREIEQFLYREARLLDEGRFEEWLELFTPDAVYWLPMAHGESDPDRQVSIIYDTRRDMERRVERLKSGYAHAQDPPSRTHRIVSNIELSGFDPGDAPLVASTVMVLFALTRHKYAIHSARCEFRLLREAAVWRIARKKVNLLRSNEALDGIPYLV
jgi:3-phenylpropionate/cinnamic acid dioxygenase small subunit